MYYTIRTVSAADWRQLRELRLRALKSDPLAFGGSYADTSAYPDSHWQERAAASEAGTESRWFVAIGRDGIWSGMALAHNGEDATARLYGMWTAPQARGSGVARALCEACAEWAREHGYSWLRLGAYADNPRAISSYQKAGFEQFEFLPAEEGRRADVVLMRRAV